MVELILFDDIPSAIGQFIKLSGINLKGGSSSDTIINGELISIYDLLSTGIIGNIISIDYVHEKNIHKKFKINYSTGSIEIRLITVEHSDRYLTVNGHIELNAFYNSFKIEFIDAHYKFVFSNTHTGDINVISINLDTSKPDKHFDMFIDVNYEHSISIRNIDGHKFAEAW